MTTPLTAPLAIPPNLETLPLNDREILLLQAMLVGAISDDWTARQYYRLGGFGYVPIRYNSRTVPNMERRGLVSREGSRVCRITDLGRRSIEKFNAK